MAKVAVIILALLAFGGAASAATIQDVIALGYTVDQAARGNCVIYAVSGFGITNNQTSSCDPGFQAFIDSIANPAADCNRKWQYNHPEQLDAFDAVGRKGYGVSGDQCADRYVVANSYTAVVVYTGPGAGLVQLATTLDAAQPAQQIPPGQNPPPVTQTCLPLCATPAAPVVPATPTTPAATQGGTAPAATPITPGPTVTLTTLAATPTVAIVTLTNGTLNPLLAAAISTKLGAKITITKQTACFVKAAKTPCSKLYSVLRKSRRQVTVRAKGMSAARITVS